MKIRLAMLSCVLAVAAFGADVTGKWTAEMTGRNGNKRTVAMDLKTDGGKLTGTIGGGQGETAIENGVVNGDDVSFTVTREMQGNTMKMNYTGKVEGDSIKFKMMREGADKPVEFTAKRVTTT